MVPRWSFFLSKKGVENLATLSFKKLLNLFIKCSCGPIRGLFLNCSLALIGDCFSWRRRSGSRRRAGSSPWTESGGFRSDTSRDLITCDSSTHVQLSSPLVTCDLLTVHVWDPAMLTEYIWPSLITHDIYLANVTSTHQSPSSPPI